MNINHYTILLIFLFNICNANVETVPSICILVGSEELSENEVIAIENRLSHYVIQIGSHKVIERRSLKYIFQEQEFQTSHYVRDNKVDELGGILGVSQILIGSISATNDMFNIDFKIDDIQTGEIIASSSRLVQKDLIDILNALPDISRELFGVTQETNQLPVSIPVRSFRINQSECTLSEMDNLNISGNDFLSFHRIENYIL